MLSQDRNDSGINWLDWIKRSIPSSPRLGPHGRLVLLVWGEVVTIEAIASIDLP